jgi:hypothetical protein
MDSLANNVKISSAPLVFFTCAFGSVLIGVFSPATVVYLSVLLLTFAGLKAMRIEKVDSLIDIDLFEIEEYQSKSKAVIEDPVQAGKEESTEPVEG